MHAIPKSLALVLLIFAIITTAAAPATAHSTSSQTLLLTGPDGSALVSQMLVFDLTNDTQENTFNEITASNESKQEYKNTFVTNLKNAADTPNDAQPNEFKSAQIRTGIDDDSNQGTVQIRVIWKGFADTTTEDRIVVNDPLKDSYQTKTQTYLYPPRDYKITGESTIGDAERRDIALYWNTGTSLDNTQLVMESETTTPTPQTDSAGENTPNENTPTTPATTPQQSPPNNTVFLGLVAALLTVAVVLLYRNYQNN